MNKQMLNPPNFNVSDNMEGFPKEYMDDFSEKATAPKRIFSRSAYKNFLKSYTVQNTDKIKGFDGLKLLKDLKPKLKKQFDEHGAIKYYVVARLLMHKTLEGKTLEKTDDFYVHTPKHEVLRRDQIKEFVGTDIDYLKDAIPERQAKVGSNWIFKRVVSIEAHTVRHKPLAGASYIELPPALKAKKAIINVKNKDDNKCFMWAVLSALHPTGKNAHRMSKYKEHIDKYDWSGLFRDETPVKLNEISKFEERNNISINVYGCRDLRGL